MAAEKCCAPLGFGVQPGLRVPHERWDGSFHLPAGLASRGGVSSKGADSRPQERHCHLLSSSLD